MKRFRKPWNFLLLGREDLEDLHKISTKDASFCRTHSIWLNSIIYAIKLKEMRSYTEGLQEKPVEESMAAVLNSQLSTPFKLQNEVPLLQHDTDKEFIDQIMLSGVQA